MSTASRRKSYAGPPMLRSGKLAALAGAAFLAMSGAVLAAEGDTIVMGTGADIKTMCGDKPTVVGLSDGFGGDTWRKEVLAELKDEASKCPNITKVLYTDGSGDPAKTNSDINSLVAQGVNVLIVFPDFGAAEIPAMRAALQAGVIVVPYNGNPGGKNGQDYSYNVYQDFEKAAGKWAAWLNENLKEGTVLYFSGPAGNGFSANFNNGIKAALTKYPKIKLLEDQWIATGWNPADAQKATAGVIAKYGKIDAFMSDFGPVTIAVIRSFEQAGLPVPYVASLASNNELNCMYLKAKGEGKAWPYMTLEGTTTQVRNALRRGLAEYQGTKNPDPLGMEAFIYADSFKAHDPKCNSAAPPDADLSGLLTEEQQKKVFAQ